ALSLGATEFLFELPDTHLQGGGRLAFLAEDLSLSAVQLRGVPDADVVSNGGGGMAVKQHLHGFLLELLGVGTPLLPLVLGGLHGTLLVCLVGVNLSSRSVHKTGYTSHHLLQGLGQDGGLLRRGLMGKSLPRGDLGIDFAPFRVKVRAPAATLAHRNNSEHGPKALPALQVKFPPAPAGRRSS